MQNIIRSLGKVAACPDLLVTLNGVGLEREWIYLKKGDESIYISYIKK